MYRYINIDPAYLAPLPPVPEARKDSITSVKSVKPQPNSLSQQDGTSNTTDLL
jgi:hypothetical protein